MVASYTWGKDAERFDGLTSDDLIAKAVEDVAAVHGLPVDLVKKNLRDGVVKQWSNDQFTLGGFALFSPSQVSSGSGKTSQTGLNHRDKLEGPLPTCLSHA